MTQTATLSALHLSDLAPSVVQSEIRAMTVACDNMGGINMAQGVCDTDPPHPVVEAAIDAIRTGHNIYTRHDGIAILREAIAEKLATFPKYQHPALVSSHPDRYRKLADLPTRRCAGVPVQVDVRPRARAARLTWPVQAR